MDDSVFNKIKERFSEGSEWRYIQGQGQGQGRGQDNGIIVEVIVIEVLPTGFVKVIVSQPAIYVGQIFITDPEYLRDLPRVVGRNRSRSRSRSGTRRRSRSRSGTRRRSRSRSGTRRRSRSRRN